MGVWNVKTANPLSCTSCLDRSSRPSGSLQTRKETETVLWRAPGSQTYVILTMGQRIVGNAVVTLLDKAYIAATNRIRNLGDSVIAHGMFTMMGETGLSLNVWNSNNHQTTYGVLSAACTALTQYMTTTAVFGKVTFHIYDGIREVGRGQIG